MIRGVDQRAARGCEARALRNDARHARPARRHSGADQCDLTASAHEPVHTPGGECLPGSQAPLAPYERFNRGANAPILVTEDCIDPRYNMPVIDAVTAGTTQAGTPYTHVHGRFFDATPGPVPQATPATFSIYFPATGYEGRFYVGGVHQLRLTGEFAATGAPEEVQDRTPSVFSCRRTRSSTPPTTAPTCCVQSQPGLRLDRPDAIGAWGNPDSQYRVAAAAAKYSRELAQTFYGYRTVPTATSTAGAAAHTSRSPTRSTPLASGTAFLPSSWGTPSRSPATSRCGSMPCASCATTTGGMTSSTRSIRVACSPRTTS